MVLALGADEPQLLKEGHCLLDRAVEHQQPADRDRALFRQHIMQLKHTMHAHTRGALDMLVPTQGGQHWGFKHYVTHTEQRACPGHSSCSQA